MNVALPRTKAESAYLDAVSAGNAGPQWLKALRRAGLEVRHDPTLLAELSRALTEQTTWAGRIKSLRDGGDIYYLAYAFNHAMFDYGETEWADETARA